MKTEELTNWQEVAPCKGATDIFFPSDNLGSSALLIAEERAKQICRSCPFMQECLELALVNREKDGIWGGMTARERRSLIRRNQRVAARERSRGFSAHG